MRREANYFTIGLFIVAGFLLLAGALVTFGVGQLFKPKIYIETYVDGTVQGIDVGSPVKFRGVSVGKVTSVGFLFTEYPNMNDEGISNYVVLVLEIEKEIVPDMFHADIPELLDRAIKQGLCVKIEPQGITGMNYMEIDYEKFSRISDIKITWKPRHYFLPSAPGELTNLLDSVNNIMREVEELNLEGISDGTVALLENLNHAVTGAQLEKLSDEAQKLFATINTAVEQADVSKLSEEAQSLLIEISKSNAELKEILGNIEPASRLNADDIAASLANLRIISDNLRAVSGEVARDPSSMLFSRPPAPSKVMDPPNRKR